ncbi:MAG: hypothetical protein WCT52_01905 [Candidatus Micrarchaeia archaeon]
MDADGSIRTQFDDLVAGIKRAGGNPISAAELSSATGLSPASVMKWLTLLEKQKRVHIVNRLSGVYVHWAGEPEKIKPLAHGTVDAAAGIRSTSDIDIARGHEEEAKRKLASESEGEKTRQADAAAPSEEELAMLRHREVIVSAGSELADVGEKIEKIGTLISELKRRKASARREAAQSRAAEVRAKPTAPTMTVITNDTPDAGASSLEELSHAEKTAKPSMDVFGTPDTEELIGEIAEEKAEPEAAKKIEPNVKPKAREIKIEEQVAQVEEQAQPINPELEEPTQLSIQENGIQIMPILPKRKVRIRKITRMEPVQPTSVSLQFSEKMARHVRKIMGQTQEIEKLKMEKEKLLAEHYMPMQRRLEVEIETISDRVLRMEKNILAIQERASELPNRVQNVEKLQISTIKAHAEMRRAHDEAGALVEEATRQLAEEREKMSMMVEQSRQELAEHRAKSEELSHTIEKINRMEEEAANLVISARGALAEQAERLAIAEVNAQELTALKTEIAEGVATAKREMGAAKGVLTGLEKQMSQMRQIEIWANSVRQEYEKKMVDIDDYIRNGNNEFETLRESVEANFVRRYLRELRQLTDSYTFELNQVKNAEGNIDQRINEEKKKLEDLLEEGRKIAYLYEMQSREIEGGDRFEKHGEEFRTLSEISASRTQLEQMIAQVVGNRSGHETKENEVIDIPRPKTIASRRHFAKAKAKSKPAAKAKPKQKKSGKAKKAGRKK